MKAVVIIAVCWSAGVALWSVVARMEADMIARTRLNQRAAFLAECPPDVMVLPLYQALQIKESMRAKR